MTDGTETCRARTVALEVVMRVLLAALADRPHLRQALLIAALDAAWPHDDLAVMRAICDLLHDA